MDSAKINSSHPLSLAKKEVLNPINKKTAKTTSRTVATNPKAGIIDSGNHGLIMAVYSKNDSQVPQVENSSLHIPSRSATADKKPKARDKRRASLMIVCIILFYKDRKSTRLNSSHVKISYAVFCLKKKIR